MDKNKLLNKLLIAGLATSVLLSTFAPIANVHAEEKEKEEEVTSYDKVKNNVASLENPKLKSAYTDASKYDISMQYNVTYNSLISNYLEKDSTYSKIYSSDAGADAYGGIGASIPKVSTGAGNLKLDEDKTEGDTELEDPDKKTDEEIQNERVASAEKIAKKFAKEYIKTTNKYYGVESQDKNKFKFNDLGHFVPNPDYFERTSDSTINENKIDKSVRDAMEKKITSHLTSKLSKSADEKSVKKDLKFELSDLKGDFKSVNNVLINKYGSKYPYLKHTDISLNKNVNAKSGVGMGQSGVGIQLFVLGSDSAKAGSSSIDEKNALQKAPNANSKTTKDRYVSQQAYRDVASYYPAMKVSSDTVKSAYDGRYDTLIANKEIKSDIKEFISLVNKDGGGTTAKSGFKVLAWTPLTPNYENEDIDKLSDFKKVMADEKIDVKEGATFQLLDENGEPRAVQVKDLFFSSAKNVSPVLLSARKKDFGEGGHLALNGSTSKDGVSLKGRMGSPSGFLGIAKTNWISSIFGTDYKLMNNDDFSDNDQSVSRSYFKAITASLEHKDLSNDKNPIGIDNYGNIISGVTGMVLIPYWQNTLFLEGLTKSGGNNAFIAHPVLNNAKSKEDKLITEMLGHVEDRTFEYSKSKELLTKSGLFGGTPNKEVTAKIDGILEDLNSQSYGKIKALMKDPDNVRAIAMMITASTSDSVKKWNSKYVSTALEEEAMYIGLTAGDFITNDSSADILNRWTASGLIQKIGMLIDLGVYTIFRLTLVNLFTDIYNSVFVNAGLSGVFNTPTVTGTSDWQKMTEPLVLLLLAFTPIYFLFLWFRIKRGKAKASDLIKQFIALSMVIVLPLWGYNAFTNLVMNKPAELVLQNQLKQTIVMDFYLDKQQSEMSKKETGDKDAYEQLFGETKDLSERSSKNYIVKFYTQTDKSGFEITDKKANENILGEQDPAKGTRANEWNKNKLVTVDVRLFDLYTWSTNQAHIRDNNTNETEPKKRQTLFSYLESEYPDLYEGVNSYKEYSVNTNTIFPSGSLLQGSTEGKNVTASKLFEDLHYNSIATAERKPDLQAGLSQVYNLTQLFSLDETTIKDNDTNYYVPTSKDIDRVMGDLSMTSATRKVAYGTSKFAPFTASLMEKTPNTEDFPLRDSIVLKEPKDDFFGVYNTVKDLNPYKNNKGAWDKSLKSVERMTYDINYQAFNSFATTYANMPKATGIEATNTEMSSALQMSLVSEVFFQLNKQLGFKNFPKSYEPDKISMDSYLKMIFIPYKDYGIDKMNFSSSEVARNNIMDYLGLRENILVLTLFLVAVVLLVVYSLFNLAVFYFVMLLLTMYKFIKEYIIGNNYANKSWVGILTIYAVLGLVKAGLVLLWYVLGLILNTEYIRNSGATFNFVFIYSLAIIAYLLFVGIFVIAKLFKTVMQNKEDLGGESFSRGVANIRGTVVAKLTGRGRNSGMGTKAGGALKRAKGVGRGTAGLTDKMLQRGKRMADNNKLNKDMSNQDKANVSVIERAMSKVKETRAGQAVIRAKNGVEGNLRAIGDKFKSATGLDKYSANKAMKESLKMRSAGLANISKDVGGVASSAVNVADKIGQKYGETTDLQATTMELGTASLAKKMAQSLIADGKKVAQNGSQLTIETSTSNLDTVEGRATMMDNTMFNLQQDLEKASKFKVSDTLLNNSDKQPLLYGNKENGSYSLLFNDKNALSTNFYNNLKNDKQFTENFTVEPSSEQRGADGTLLNNTEVNILPKKNVSEEKVQSLFRSFYEKDSNFRKDNRMLERAVDGTHSFLNLANMSQAERAEITSQLPDGAMIQGNGVVYNTKQNTHKKFIKNVSENLKTTANNNKKNLQEAVSNTTNYIQKGGSNGFLTDTQSSKHNPAVLAQFGDVDPNRLQLNIGSTSLEQQATKNTIAVASAIATIPTEVKQNFVKNQAGLLQEGVRLLKTNGHADGASRLLNSLGEEEGVKSTKAYKELTKMKKVVDKDFKKGLITEESYSKVQEQIFNNSLQLANDSHTLDRVMLSEVNAVNPDLKDSYLTAKATLSSKLKTNNAEVDKFTWDSGNLANIENAFKDVSNVDSDGQVGTISAKSKIDSGAITNIIASTNDKSFQTKSYVPDYESQSDTSEKVESAKVNKDKKAVNVSDKTKNFVEEAKNEKAQVFKERHAPTRTAKKRDSEV